MPLTEFALISRYFSQLGRGAGVDLAVGDDCAIVRLEAGERLATSVDTMLSGVHFLEDTLPEHIALRAVSAAASDLAAMGARPLAMTLSLSLPAADGRINKLTAGLPEVNQRLVELIAARREGFLAAAPSADRGRAVFETRCGVCHRLAGSGAKIGPDLDGIGGRGLERLLEDVLDPNRNVDQAFRALTVATDGRLAAFAK